MYVNLTVLPEISSSCSPVGSPVSDKTLFRQAPLQHWFCYQIAISSPPWPSPTLRASRSAAPSAGSRAPSRDPQGSPGRPTACAQRKINFRGFFFCLLNASYFCTHVSVVVVEIIVLVPASAAGSPVAAAAAAAAAKAAAIAWKDTRF